LLDRLREDTCDVPIFSTMLPSLAMFAVPRIADIRHRDRNVRFVPILLQKSKIEQS
jgi:hypothetical protein